MANSNNEKTPAGVGKKAEETRPLEKTNYILIGISLLLIIVGFLLISGEPSTEEAFNPDIFSTVRTGVGPTLSFLGFVMMFFAILYKKKEKK